MDTTPCLLTCLAKLGVTEGNVIHMQTKGNFFPLPDSGEPELDICELHFAARPVSNCDTILPWVERNILKIRRVAVKILRAVISRGLLSDSAMKK